MKTLPTLITLALSFAAHADPKSGEVFPIGAFTFSAGDAEGRLSIGLTCEIGPTCTFRTVSASAGRQPAVESSKLDQIVRLQKIPEMVTGALQYAVENRDKSITLRDNAAFMKASRAMLSASPEVTGCWDLNDPTPRYHLACTVRTQPSGAEQMVLFVALLANCRDGFGFCGYVTMPLDRAPALPSSTPEGVR